VKLKGKLLHYLGHLLLLILLAVLLFPFLVMVGTSMKSFGDVYTSPPAIFPSTLNLNNYMDIFGEFKIGGYFRNSTIIAVGATLITLICTIPASYALGRLRFPGRRVVLYIMLAVIMFSPVVVVISLFQLMGQLGLLDQHFPLMLVNAAFSLAFCTWMLTAYLHSIPPDMEEAAMIDGSSRFGAFARVVLPLATPGIATVVIFAFIQAWNEFLLANTLVISQDKKPLSVALYVFVGYHETKWQYLMAATLLATIPVVVLFLLIQRYMVQGLVGGALK
jgi:multiple sugar transport system permease protein